MYIPRVGYTSMYETTVHTVALTVTVYHVRMLCVIDVSLHTYIQ